eukprot:GFYU01002873.1.p1 GENE.GFYU01002873.1~~GFYU01002873.1.p1  ORF type:complete len:398 (-),score=79.24 GFYU01002873.1:154-1347(-)
MIVYSPRGWKLIFRLKGSVLRRVYKEILISALAGIVANLLITEGVSEANKPIIDPKSHSYLSVPLAFLLIFRSNLSYQRYWEGRSTVGGMVKACREGARTTAVYLLGDEDSDKAERSELRRLFNTMFLLIQQEIYGASISQPKDLRSIPFLTKEERHSLSSVTNRPQLCAQWMSQRAYNNYRKGRLEKIGLKMIEAQISTLVGGWMACMKIVKTPMPFPYVQMLNLFLLIYVFSLPFTFAHIFGWFTPIFAGVIAFALYGIYQVGVEIENPFGLDDNDLPLDKFAEEVFTDTGVCLEARDGDVVVFEKEWGNPITFSPPPKRLAYNDYSIMQAMEQGLLPHTVTTAPRSTPKQEEAYQPSAVQEPTAEDAASPRASIAHPGRSHKANRLHPIVKWGS